MNLLEGVPKFRKVEFGSVLFEVALGEAGDEGKGEHAELPDRSQRFGMGDRG